MLNVFCAGLAVASLARIGALDPDPLAARFRRLVWPLGYVPPGFVDELGGVERTGRWVGWGVARLRPL